MSFDALSCPNITLPMKQLKMITLGDWVNLNTFLYWDEAHVSLWRFENDQLYCLPVGDHTTHILQH